MLIRYGLVHRIGTRGSNEGTNMVAEEDLEDFLARFRADGVAVSSPSPGMKSVVDASRVARRPVIEIIQAILAGELSQVERLSAKHRFASVLVEPGEVVQVLDAKLAQDRMTLAQVSEVLGLEPDAVRTLMPGHDAEGKTFLRSIGVMNAIGTNRNGRPAAAVASWRGADLFLLTPFSKMAHGFYRMAALTCEAGAARRAGPAVQNG